MENSEICFRAAELIETKGHAKEWLRDPETGGYCLYGALNVAKYGDSSWHRDRSGRRNYSDTHTKISLTIHDLLGLETPDYEGSVTDEPVTWNNAEERTATEVIDILRHAGKILKEEELLSNTDLT